MPCRIRAFCTGTRIPTLAQVFEQAKARGISLAPDEAHGPTDVNDPGWSEAEISYKPGKGPLVVECNRDDDTDDCLARVEPQEFIGGIESLPATASTRRVIEHLRATRFIVASQLLGDIDDDGYNANGTFLNYFVEHCGGMIHADGEGFYEGDEVILDVG